MPVRWLGIFLAIVIVSACGEQPDDGGFYALPEGLRAQVYMEGQVFEMEVAAVAGQTAILQYFWQDRLVSERRQYRGLFSLSGYDGDIRFVSDVDTAAIERLFPLKIGNEVSFGGTFRYEASNFSGSLWVTMAVVDTDEVAIKDGRFDVFVVHVSTMLSVAGEVRSVTRVLYYSPELGLPLKMEMSDGMRRSYWRITALDMSPSRVRRNRLGTVMI